VLPERADDVEAVGHEAAEFATIAGHAGYVAGRHTDGSLTESDTDVRLPTDGRYTAYVPRCECGWTGPPFSTSHTGYAACARLWRTKHLQLFLQAREPRGGRWTPTVIQGRFLP
jgi:hypothetical protein